MFLKRIFIITGTPGVGKTSVSEELASNLKAIHIDLSEFVRKEALFIDVDEVRMTLIPDMHAVSKRLEKIMESMGDVIIDGHFAMDILPSEKINSIFVLRRDPDSLREILENRGYEGRRLWENIAAEILDTCLFDAIEIHGIVKVHEIDVTDKEIKEIVEKLILIIENKMKGTVGVVNWLDKLDKNGSLEGFFEFF